MIKGDNVILSTLHHPDLKVLLIVNIRHVHVICSFTKQVTDTKVFSTASDLMNQLSSRTVLMLHYEYEGGNTMHSLHESGNMTTRGYGDHSLKLKKRECRNRLRQRATCECTRDVIVQATFYK